MINFYACDQVSICLGTHFQGPNWRLLFQTTFPGISVCLGE